MMAYTLWGVIMSKFEDPIVHYLKMCRLPCDSANILSSMKMSLSLCSHKTAESKVSIRIM